MKTWELERRIRRVFLRSTPAERKAGRSWYREAQRFAHGLADNYGVADWQAAGVLAAISPGNPWELNKRQAEELINWRTSGMQTKVPSVSTYSDRNRVMALRILDGERPIWPRGPKVTAFYKLILRGGRIDDVVCVDGHAVNAAHGVRRPMGTYVKETEVRRVREAYRRLARKLGVRVSTLQATVWLTWRRENDAR